MPRKEKPDKALKELGQILKKLRISNGLKQEDLENFDISSKHYQDIERGVTNPTYLTLKKIAKAFSCKISDIFKDC